MGPGRSYWGFSALAMQIERVQTHVVRTRSLSDHYTSAQTMVFLVKNGGKIGVQQHSLPSVARHALEGLAQSLFAIFRKRRLQNTTLATERL